MYLSLPSKKWHPCVSKWSIRSSSAWTRVLVLCWFCKSSDNSEASQMDRSLVINLVCSSTVENMRWIVLSIVASFDVSGSFCSFEEGNLSMRKPPVKSCERDTAASMSFFAMWTCFPSLQRSLNNCSNSERRLSPSPAKRFRISKEGLLRLS